MLNAGSEVVPKSKVETARAFEFVADKVVIIAFCAIWLRLTGAVLIVAFPPEIKHEAVVLSNACENIGGQTEAALLSANHRREVNDWRQLRTVSYYDRSLGLLRAAQISLVDQKRRKKLVQPLHSTAFRLCVTKWLATCACHVFLVLELAKYLLLKIFWV